MDYASEPWLKAAWGNGSRRLLIAALFFLGCIAILVATAIGTLLAGAKYNPLGEYPVQRVTGSDYVGRDFTDSPVVVDSTGQVYVTATKCSAVDEDVDVRGVLRWRRVDPPGKVVFALRGSSIREPGCTVFNYENDVPPEVAADVLRHGASTWQLIGDETPVDPDGKEGVSRLYESQNFLVIP